MLVDFGLDEFLVVVQLDLDVFEFLLFFQRQDGDAVLQLTEIAVGLVELMTELPV